MADLFEEKDRKTTAGIFNSPAASGLNSKGVAWTAFSRETDSFAPGYPGTPPPSGDYTTPWSYGVYEFDDPNEGIPGDPIDIRGYLEPQVFGPAIQRMQDMNVQTGGILFHFETVDTSPFEFDSTDIPDEDFEIVDIDDNFGTTIEGGITFDEVIP